MPRYSPGRADCRQAACPYPPRKPQGAPITLVPPRPLRTPRRHRRRIWVRGRTRAAGGGSGLGSPGDHLKATRRPRRPLMGDQPRSTTCGCFRVSLLPATATAAKGPVGPWTDRLQHCLLCRTDSQPVRSTHPCQQPSIPPRDLAEFGTDGGCFHARPTWNGRRTQGPRPSYSGSRLSGAQGLLGINWRSACLVLPSTGHPGRGVTSLGPPGPGAGAHPQSDRRRGRHRRTAMKARYGPGQMPPPTPCGIGQLRPELNSPATSATTPTARIEVWQGASL